MTEAGGADSASAAPAGTSARARGGAAGAAGSFPERCIQLPSREFCGGFWGAEPGGDALKGNHEVYGDQSRIPYVLRTSKQSRKLTGVCLSEKLLVHFHDGWKEGKILSVKADAVSRIYEWMEPCNANGKPWPILGHWHSQQSTPARTLGS